jgi:hypothetical protein
MRESAKELFSGQPDLLHHIVTTMNPNVLQVQSYYMYTIYKVEGPEFGLSTQFILFAKNDNA